MQRWEKYLKKNAKKFGELKKVRIFAARLRNNGSCLTILKDKVHKYLYNERALILTGKNLRINGKLGKYLIIQRRV